MTDYVLSEQAKEQLKNIYTQGYVDFGEQQAEKYFTALCHRFDAIAERPFSYPSVADIREGYRRSVCGKHSIFYRITGQTVEIMAILKYQNVIDCLE